jgi:Holliday junction resolvase RusA-like endonuclease
MKKDETLNPVPLVYEIPGNPVTKKNSQRIIRRKTGGTMILPSAAYEAYRNTALYFLQPAPPRPISKPVNICCIYYMQTRRRVDLSNLVAATHDILVYAGIIADDNRDIVAGMDGSRVLYDKDRPRVEIYILPMEDYRQWSEEAPPRRAKPTKPDPDRAPWKPRPKKRRKEPQKTS